MDAVKMPYSVFANHWNFITNIFIRIQMQDAAIACGSEARRFFLQNFEDQGFHGDNGFKAWRKRKKHYSWPILDKTGRLKNSMVTKLRSANPVRETVRTAYYRFREKPWEELNEGPLRVYAAFHNQPDNTYTYPYPNIQRQFIGHSKKLETRISDILMTALKAAIRDARHFIP